MAATIDKSNISLQQRQTASVFKHKQRGDGYCLALNNFVHSTVPAERYNHIRPSIHQSLYLHETKNLVLHLNRFKKLCELDSSYNYENLKGEFTKVIFELLSLPFDNISYSLTFENSVFFILLKDDFEFHLNYFFNDENYGFGEEAVLITYINGVKQPSKDDGLDDVILHLKSILNPEETYTFWL